MSPDFVHPDMPSFPTSFPSKVVVEAVIRQLVAEVKDEVKDKVKDEVKDEAPGVTTCQPIPWLGGDNRIPEDQHLWGEAAWPSGFAASQGTAS